MSSSRPHAPLSDSQSPLSGSKLRKLLPAPGSNHETTSSDSSQGPSLQPRLLPRANITKIACEPCRKRKAKCCGERPKCKACINKGVECHYQASDQDLLDLKRKHDELQEKINIYERLYNLLMNLPEQDSHAILGRLRECPDAATTILQVDDGDLFLQLASAPETRLSKGKAVENLSDWLRGALSSGGGGLSTVATPGSNNANLGDASASTPAGDRSRATFCPLGLDPENATSNNPDAKVMSSSEESQSWITSWEEGVRDDHMPDELPRSPGLDHVPFTLDHREWKGHPPSAGDHFFKESQRLFDQATDHHSLTTVQALGIMSIREASCGRSSESRYYAGQSIRLAFEMGLHRTPDKGDKEELVVQLATFWGAFSLDNASSLVTGSLPNCSYSPHLPSKPAVVRDVEASVWVPYTDDDAPLQLQYEQLSNERSVYKCLCELSELVHESIYLLHSPRKSLTAHGLLGMYTEYLDWYNGVPEVLRLGHNFTPAVLFAHMYYHFATLLLFSPFVKLRIIGSNVSPREVCLHAANAIQDFLTSYSRLYTLKWAPSFVPYFALASSIMHLALTAGTVQINKLDTAVRADPHLSEAVKQGIARLSEMTSCHHIAEQGLHLLRYLAKKWDIVVNIETGAALDPEEEERLVKSLGGIVNFFSPTVVVQDSVSDSAADNDVSEATSCEPGKAVENLEDPLVLPSVMQRRLVFSKNKALEEAGFAVL
ncbi:hypothetical protein BFJ69_g16586 [Fusarium oxysporum]|uniref:Zn(2)-C6 fungal-type domain-containing protein n=1 Tax=Fusarium oxysporum TaxID=5507 RepID=A0A420MAQ7_FUSOX|nr:hypothetical protein BFJ69_g16586 [Fusarium oxysporum]